VLDRFLEEPDLELWVSLGSGPAGAMNAEVMAHKAGRRRCFGSDKRKACANQQ
jgi:hypothetical protein